jgi:hypothetical protein
MWCFRGLECDWRSLKLYHRSLIVQISKMLLLSLGWTSLYTKTISWSKCFYWKSVHDVCNICYSTCNIGVKTKEMYIGLHNDVMARPRHFWHCELFLAHNMKPPPSTNGRPQPKWLVIILLFSIHFFTQAF